MDFTPPSTDKPVDQAFTPPETDRPVDSEAFAPPVADQMLSKVRGSTVDELAQDNDFDPLQNFNAIQGSATPEDVQKLQEVYKKHRTEGFNTGRFVAGIKEVPGAVADLAKGGVKAVKDIGQGIGGSRKAGAELTAAVDTAGTSDATLFHSALRKMASFGPLLSPVPTLIGKALGENWNPKTMTDQDWHNQFFTDAALQQQHEQSTEGKGELAKAIGSDADTLEKEGGKIDKNAVAQISGVTDPINLLPIGAGWEAVSQSGLKLFTAPTKELAASVAQKLGKGVQWAGQKTVEAAGQIRGKSATAAIIGTATGHPAALAAFAAPYAVKGAGKALEFGGKVLTGEAVPQSLIDLASRATESGVSGAAAGIPFAAAQDDERNMAPMLGVGAALGVAGGELAHGKEVAGEAVKQKSEQFVAKPFEQAEKPGAIVDRPAYGTDPSLDEAHATAMDTLRKVDPATANEVNRLRAILPALYEAHGAKGPSPEAYVLPAAEFDSSFPAAKGQAGFIDPDTNRAFFRLDGNDIQSVRHESGHLLAQILPEDVRQKAISALEKTYNIPAFGKLYDADFNANRPGEKPVTFSPEYYAEELLTEHLSAMLRGDRLDGSAKDYQSKLGSILESAGLYKPGIGEKPNTSNVSELGVKVSPKVVNALSDFFKEGISSPEAREALAKLQDNPPVISEFVPPATDKPVVTRETPVDLSQPKPGLLTQPPKELFEQSPPPYVREGNPPVGLATEPPPAELFGGFGRRPNVEVPAPEEGHVSGKSPAPTVRADEFGAPEPAPATVDEEKPSNIRVTPEQQAKLNRPPERTDIGIQEAEAALKDSSPEQQAVFNQIREHLNQPQGDISPVEVTYNSVTPEDNAPATERTARRTEQAGQESRTEAQKLVVPTGFTVTKGGKVQVTGYSPDKVLSNAVRIAEDAAGKQAGQLIPYALKEGQFTPEAEAKFYRDLQTYSSNQANGYRGDGKTIIRPKDFTGYLPPENPAYTPKPLSEQVAAFLNLSMGIAPPKTARVSKSSFTGEAIKPTNVRARELALANEKIALKPGVIGDAEKQVFKDFGNVEIAEFNPLRKQLDEHGVNTRERIETTERLNLGQIESVTPKPESSFRAPVADAISAGFMPRRAGAPASIEDFSKLSPDDFKRAVLTSPGGLTGTAIALGKKISPESLKEINALIDQAHMKAGEFKAKGDWDNALAEASRGQFFREASEAARAAGGEKGLSVTPEGTARYMPTEAFTKWFGESKAVNEDGTPAILYHGTRGDFKKFDKINGGNQWGPGHYFTTSPEEASNYATGENVNRVTVDKNKGAPSVMPVYVRSVKPFRVSKDVLMSDAEVKAIDPEAEGHFDKGYPATAQNVWTYLVSNHRPERAVKMLKEAGYDAITDGHVWSVFEGGQIKSAIGNKGTFNPAKDDIRFMPFRKEEVISPDAKLESEKGYVYHATNLERANEIAESGHLNTFDPSYGTDQQVWPDGSGETRSYWSNKAGAVWQFAPEDGKSVVLRTARTSDFKDESTGDVYAKSPIPADKMQILTKDGWKPLVENPQQQFKFMPKREDSPEFLPGFFSQLERTVASDKFPNAATPEQVRGILGNPQNGIKADELKWSGVDEFLAGKTKVTKQELRDFLAGNQMRIKEVEKKGFKPQDFTSWNETTPGDEGPREWELSNHDTGTKYASIVHENDVYSLYRGDSGRRVSRYPTLEQAMDHGNEYLPSEAEAGDNNTKFDKYVLPGGKNYREKLFTLPPKAPKVSKETPREIGNRLFGGDMSIYDRTPEQQQQIEAALHKTIDTVDAANREVYTSSHWDESNVLAHARTAEHETPDGKKVLLAEEIQSDWHQAGRRKGYNQSGVWRIVSEDERRGIATLFRTKAEAEQTQARDYSGWTGYKVKFYPEQSTGGVPEAPFKTSWHEFVFKALLRDAVAKGDDYLAWTPGELQADRYDLSKQVEKIYWQPEEKILTAYVKEKGWQQIASDVEESKLPDYIGKDAAEKIVKPEFRDAHASENSGTTVHSLEGDNLKVGGEGMKGFYDKILVQFANKYGKKWGAKVEQIPLAGKDAPKVWALPITDAMRQSVEKGQPLFMPKASEKSNFGDADIRPAIHSALNAGHIVIVPRGGQQQNDFSGLTFAPRSQHNNN